MRIVIDLQAAQSPGSAQRGIGRYSVQLAKAMLRHRGAHEIIIALNGMYPDTIGPLRAMFRGLMDERDIRVWHATAPPLPVAGPPVDYREAAHKVRDRFMASLRPDIVHVTSMFEAGAFSCVGTPTDDDRPRTAVTLYDLIPHIYADIYLASPQVARDYAAKIENLCRADLWLAISESSRHEGMDRLGLPADRVVNISSAIDDHFTPGHVPPAREAALRQQYGLWRPFVMYTGGVDHRKNIGGLIQAWGTLPQALRTAHQLAVVCSVRPDDRARMEQVAAESGLAFGELVLTGFVPEADLVDLYRLCKLFVFPSQHEGFGLPPLEAMACGAPVIGAGNSSIPEVIGRDDALFDARSQASIAAKIQECLSSPALLADLAEHGLRQARRFSWDDSARTALTAMEALPPRPATAPAPRTGRPRLAFVSPLPPLQSGIADYSADLLPALAEHYEIDIVTDQPVLEALPAGCFAQRRGTGWFMAHGHEYDRVVYQMGNHAGFHGHMPALMQRHPGTVVLHDFYLGDLQANLPACSPTVPPLLQALYESHGWPAVAEHARASDLRETIARFPANFDVLRAAAGVIVHSRSARELARRWYGAGLPAELAEVPLLRAAAEPDRDGARAALGLGPGDFLVCSFGLLGPTKMNHRLVQAWNRSALATDASCHLVFVGENEPGAYGLEITRLLGTGHGGRQRITGWVGRDEFRQYLDAADLAVQLRTQSRGETSAAALDAMNHGVALVANASGALDVPAEAALLLPGDFSDEALAAALEALWRDAPRRQALGQAGRRIVQTRHSPGGCAAAYVKAIEHFAARPQHRARLIAALRPVLPADMGPDALQALARGIALNHPGAGPRQLVLDITPWTAAPSPGPLPPLLRALAGTPFSGWRAEPACLAADGQWRYARSFMLREFGPPADALPDDVLELARDDVWCAFTSGQADAPPRPARAVELCLPALRLPPEGDVSLVWPAITCAAPPSPAPKLYVDISELVHRDSHTGIQRVVKNYLFELLRNPPAGCEVVPVYATLAEPGFRLASAYLLGVAGLPRELGRDLAVRPHAGDIYFGLDLQAPIAIRQSSYLQPLRARGVRVAYMVYDLLPVRLPQCFFPEAVADHARWLEVVAQSDMAVCISQAVADDMACWLAERGVPPEARPRLEAVHLGADLAHSLPWHGLPDDAQALLAHVQRLRSFLMVGTIEPRKCHAQVLDAFEQLWAQGIDAALVIVGRAGWLVEPLVERLRRHPERGTRLLWLEQASDELLQRLYAACSCLLAASLGEGFGLPLVEAAQHGLPILARDLPVFREVAGRHAAYFSDDSPTGLAASLREWLAQREGGSHPVPDGMPWLTWAQSADRLKDVLATLAPDEANP
jgi:glycosyltransferase involved in cell wall biosynthesis